VRATLARGYAVIEEGTKYGGKFRIDGKDRSGELTLNGRETNLYVHDPDVFRPDAIEERCIQGVLHDLSRVSLLECNAPPLTGSAIVGKERYRFTDIFPHFALHGDRHLGPTNRVIRSIHLVVDDARVIFYDFDAFAHVLVPRRHIRSLVKSNARRVGRDIPVGKLPAIAYYTGKERIFTVDTVLGQVSASHNPRWNLGGPDGVFIQNAIAVDIRFPRPAVFQEAIDAVSTILLFLDLVAGRRQNLKNVKLQLSPAGRRPAILQLYWSMPPRRGLDVKGRSPQPGDLPLSAGTEPDVFAGVLKHWLRRHDTWGEARSRFSDSFSQQNSFSIDRLIRSANVFDLLPPTAAPSDVPLSEETEEARDAARRIFKKLPETPSRNSVLDALGRIGKASLRDKINCRAKHILDVHGAKLIGLLDVLNLAVDCRNHYVHGSDPKVRYSKHFFETVPFLTESLEFVFAASDLMDAGWDFAAFRQRGTTMSHPFGAYLVNYSHCLRTLNSVLPQKEHIGPRG
jgi:hypothetical protein